MSSFPSSLFQKQASLTETRNGPNGKQFWGFVMVFIAILFFFFLLNCPLACKFKDLNYEVIHLV